MYVRTYVHTHGMSYGIPCFFLFFRASTILLDSCNIFAPPWPCHRHHRRCRSGPGAAKWMSTIHGGLTIKTDSKTWHDGNKPWSYRWSDGAAVSRRCSLQPIPEEKWNTHQIYQDSGTKCIKMLYLDLSGISNPSIWRHCKTNNGFLGLFYRARPKTAGPSATTVTLPPSLASSNNPELEGTRRKIHLWFVAFPTLQQVSQTWSRGLGVLADRRLSPKIIGKATANRSGFSQSEPGGFIRRVVNNQPP